VAIYDDLYHIYAGIPDALTPLWAERTQFLTKHGFNGQHEHLHHGAFTNRRGGESTEVRASPRDRLRQGIDNRTTRSV
jgi:hypothetical protein